MTNLRQVASLVECALEHLEGAAHEFDPDSLEWSALADWYHAIERAVKVLEAVKVPAEVAKAIQEETDDDREAIRPGDYHYYETPRLPTEAQP